MPILVTKSLNATFMRGGTSNGLMIHRHALPSDAQAWQPILSSAMGSPDPYGRQLNGMGSGISSTSKVMVVEKSQRPNIDIDYTFVQVGIKDGTIDMAGNCGNMSSAIGPFAVNENLISPSTLSASTSPDDPEEITLRLFNTNTSKTIYSTFAVSPSTKKYNPNGTYSIDGVPSTGSQITLSFLSPSGSKTNHLLPTGKPIDTLTLPDSTEIQASLIDIANPGVFIRAADLSVPGTITPDELSANASLMAKLENIRRTGATAMGLDPDVQSVPKVVLLSSPSEEDSEVNIICRALSMQQAHKAVPLTLALNLGASCRVPGTLPALLAKGVQAGTREGMGTVTIAHASGKLEVGSEFDDKGGIVSAKLLRTARVLMKGEVFYTVEEQE